MKLENSIKKISQLEKDQSKELEQITNSRTVLKDLESKETSFKEQLEEKLELVRNEAQKSQI